MKDPRKKTSSDLDVRVALLESVVLQQNAAVDQRLAGIERVLKEVHDKQDKYILNTSVKIEGIQGQINLTNEKVASTNNKINRFSAGILTIFAAIIGGIFSMPEIFGFKK